MAKDTSVLLSEKDEWIAIDYFRLVCVLLIVSIHLPVFISVDGVLSHYFNHVVCRIAVPFFFISAGFFVADKINTNAAYRYVKRILLLYVLYTVIYLPQCFYGVTWEMVNLSYIVYVARVFLLVGSYVQLWYLIGLAFAVVALKLLVSKLRVNDMMLAVMGCILYFIGVVGNSYREILSGADIDLMNRYYEIFITMRNGLFFGLPLVVAGYLIRKNAFRIKDVGYLKWTVIFILCMFCEAAFIYRYFNGGEKDMMFLTLPASICFFLTACFIRQDRAKFSGFGIRCRNYSVTIFGLHLFVYFYINRLLEGYGYYLYEHSVLRYVIVITVTLALSFVIVELSKNKHFRWLKVFY